MVQGNIRDNGEQRVSDVGGIEPTTNADFENTDFDRRAGEILKGHRGECLEEAGMLIEFASTHQIPRYVFDARVYLSKLWIADAFTIDRNPFIHS